MIFIEALLKGRVRFMLAKRRGQWISPRQMGLWIVEAKKSDVL